MGCTHAHTLENYTSLFISLPSTEDPEYSSHFWGPVSYIEVVSEWQQVIVVFEFSPARMIIKSDILRF